MLKQKVVKLQSLTQSSHSASLNINLGQYSQRIIFFVAYESAQQAWMLHNIRLQRLSNVKCSNLLAQFINYEDRGVLWIRPLFGIIYPSGLYNNHIIGRIFKQKTSIIIIKAWRANISIWTRLNEAGSLNYLL